MDRPGAFYLLDGNGMPLIIVAPVERPGNGTAVVISGSGCILDGEHLHRLHKTIGDVIRHSLPE